MCMKTVLLDAIHRGEFPMSVEDRNVGSRELDVLDAGTTTQEPHAQAADVISDDTLAIDSTATQVIDSDESPRPLDGLQEKLAECGTLTQVNAVDESYQFEIDQMNLTDSERACALEALTAAADDQRERIRSKRGPRANKKD